MAKKKAKYPADRELKSKAAQSGEVTYSHYTSLPESVVRIKKRLPEEAKADLEAAVDDILAFHNL